MEYKQAIAVLMNLLKKDPLCPKEKEAILTGIGLLDMASIAKNSIKNKIKSQKAKQDKDTKW
jgi:hypothetical protein